MNMLNKIGRRVMALHHDEKGADMVEYILIVAAVALPLLAVAIWFWKDIASRANQWWEAIKGNDTPAGILPPP